MSRPHPSPLRSSERSEPASQAKKKIIGLAGASK